MLLQLENSLHEVRESGIPVLSDRIECNSKETKRLLRKVLDTSQRVRGQDRYATVNEANQLKARLDQVISEPAELDGHDQSAKTPSLQYV